MRSGLYCALSAVVYSICRWHPFWREQTVLINHAIPWIACPGPSFALHVDYGRLPFERLRCAWKRHAADDHLVDSVSFVFGTRKAPSRNAGQNFVARRSAQRHRDEDKIQAWKRDNPGAALHGEVLIALYDSWAYSSFPPANCDVTCLALRAGIFLESASVSSPHAIICKCLLGCAHLGAPNTVQHLALWCSASV